MDFTKAMEQAQQLQQQMQENLAKLTVEASAGGGMVTAVVNGRQEVVDIRIEAEVINPEDPEMLRDLIKAAVNSAIDKSRALAAEEMQKLLGGLPFPPGFMGGMGGGGM